MLEKSTLKLQERDKECPLSDPTVKEEKDLKLYKKMGGDLENI